MAHSRRKFLATTVGACIAAAGGSQALARTVEEFAGGATPLESGLNLDIAAAVENGAFVSVAVEAVSTMNGDDMVEAILLVAPENPRTTVAEFRFSELSGSARVATRMRLAKSQEIMALARMKGGALRIARQRVTVAVGGCQ